MQSSTPEQGVVFPGSDTSGSSCNIPAGAAIVSTSGQNPRPLGWRHHIHLYQSPPTKLTIISSFLLKRSKEGSVNPLLKEGVCSTW